MILYKGNTQYKVMHKREQRCVELKNNSPYFCEYIQSSGTQYITIDDITKFTSSFEMSADLEIVSYGDSNQPTFMCFFGVQCYLRQGNNYDFRCWTSTGGNFTSSVICQLGRKYQVTYSINSNSLRTIKIDFGNTVSSSGSYVSNWPVNLFSWLQSGTTSNYAPSMKLYGCRIKRDGVLIRDLRPCSKNREMLKPVGCLYDLITDKYYTNTGSGAFTLGPKL